MTRKKQKRMNTNKQDRSNHNTMTEDSMSDVEKVSRGDCQYVFYEWDDLDQQFWGDDEKDSDSSDFQVSGGERNHSCTCLRCQKPILCKTRYCSACYQDRWKWLPNRPTRILRKKIILKRKHDKKTACSNSSHDSLEHQILKSHESQLALPLSQYTNLPSSRKYIQPLINSSSTESSSQS